MCSLGISQGLAWSMTVNMKIDLVGPGRLGGVGVKTALAAERNGRQRRRAVRYGSSTALITWTIPFDAEISVAAMPAVESASRVSVPPFSMW